MQRLFHASVVVLHVYTLWYDQNFIKFPFVQKQFGDLPFKGRSAFLTMWCLVIQTLYFTIALLNDFFGDNNSKQPPLITKIKNVLFSLAFPIALYVTGAFWGIYAIDKDLIFPEALAKVMPQWVNHVMHTTVLLFITIELILSNKIYPSRKVGYSILIGFNLLYVVWFHIIYFSTGVWVYPFFTVLNIPSRLLFIAISILFGVVCYALGEKFNSLVWYPSRKTKERKYL